MKHGDKAKAKSAKASRKASDKKGSKASPPKGSSKAIKTSASKAKSGRKEPAPKAVPRAEAVKTRDRPAVSAGDASFSFTNPVVGAAFKRAVKKYSNAFRRLTD